MSTDNTKKELTAEECLESVAKKYKYKSWQDIHIKVGGTEMDAFYIEAANLYASQQTASMADENKLYQEFKKLLGDIDPFEFIKVSKKHSAFELMLEHVLHTNKIQELSEELERVKAALKFTKKKIDSFECECDDYNGFTCGIHEWRDKVNHALKSENNESNNNGREV